MTPAEAAQRAGVHRSTISKALKARDLQGVRDNRNRWRVDPDDLDRWIADRSAHTAPHSAAETLDTATELAALRAVEVELRARIVDLKDERDAWRAQAQRRWWHAFRRA